MFGKDTYFLEKKILVRNNYELIITNNVNNKLKMNELYNQITTLFIHDSYERIEIQIKPKANPLLLFQYRSICFLLLRFYLLLQTAQSILVQKYLY